MRVRPAMVLVWFVCLGLSASAAAAPATYVAVDRGVGLYRAPDRRSTKLTTTGKRVLRFVAKRGRWLEVALPYIGYHCGLPARSNLRMHLFVRRRDVMRVARRRVRKRFADGSWVVLRKGTPLDSARLRRLVTPSDIGIRFTHNKRWLKTVRGRHRRLVHSTDMVMGDGTRIRVRAGDRLVIVRRKGNKVLAQSPAPCVVNTGWVDKHAFERTPSVVGGVLGGVPGGVVGGVLGGPTLSLRRNAPVYWPDGTRAGTTRRRIWFTGARRAGRLRCVKLVPAYGIRTTMLCFDPRDATTTRGRSPFGSMPPPPPPPKPPKLVPYTALRSHLVRGTRRIVPNKATQEAVVRSGKHRLIAAMKMCVNARGRVMSLRWLRRSGYPSYDHEVKTQLRAWRFRPYKINGRAVPVCSAVTLIYRPKH